MFQSAYLRNNHENEELVQDYWITVYVLVKSKTKHLEQFRVEKLILHLSSQRPDRARIESNRVIEISNLKISTIHHLSRPSEQYFHIKTRNRENYIVFRVQLHPL